MNEFKRYIDICGSQAEAARRLGISPGYVSRLLAGDRVISPVLADKIHKLTRGRIKRDRLIWPDQASA